MHYTAENINMNFTFWPKFEEVALVKLAGMLWNQDNIRDLMSVFNFRSTHRVRKKKWQKIENKVAKKIPKLPLPTLMVKRLKGILKPLGLQIMTWQKIHMNDSYLGLQLPSNFSWTFQGTIDYKRTAERLVKDENIDLFKRYKLACTYCLEEDINMLWSRLPETLKNDLCNEESEIYDDQNGIVIYWSDILNKEMSLDIPVPVGIRTGESVICRRVFRHAVLALGNVVATKYFFQKLPPRDRKPFLEVTIVAKLIQIGVSIPGPSEYFQANSEIVFFLLSQMKGEQRQKIISAFPFELLACYLEWPMQRFYIETANNLWNFFDEREYYFTLLNIANKVKSGLKDFPYKELLEVFWQDSPERFKSFMKDMLGDKFSPEQLCE